MALFRFDLVFEDCVYFQTSIDFTWGLLEPDVACFSANFEGLQVQEVAFSSKTFEQVKVIPPFFKGAEDASPKEDGHVSHCPGHSAGGRGVRSLCLFCPMFP